VENNDSQTFDQATWDSYSTLVIADAVVAESLGVDEFLVGNEVSIHNDNSADFDDTNLPAKVKTLCTACVGFTKVKGYEEGWWKKDAWYSAGLGSVSKLYFTLYESESDFITYAKDIKLKFGTSAAIGEWSTQSDMATSGSGNEQTWADLLITRKNVLRGLDLQNYHFCFRDTGSGNNDQGFGLWKNTVDVAHLAWDYVFP
jgi:hypothetical protein